MQAFWRPGGSEVLVARSRFLETAFGAAFRNLLTEFKDFAAIAAMFFAILE